jgi:hypothetical protein
MDIHENCLGRRSHISWRDNQRERYGWQQTEHTTSFSTFFRSSRISGVPEFQGFQNFMGSRISGVPEFQGFQNFMGSRISGVPKFQGFQHFMGSRISGDTPNRNRVDLYGSLFTKC